MSGSGSGREEAAKDQAPCKCFDPTQLRAALLTPPPRHSCWFSLLNRATSLFFCLLLHLM